MTINEMRTRILAILAEHYGNGTMPDKATDDAIAQQFFVRKKDASIIRKFCKDKLLQISFREAGEYTLTWIDKGNPCKGHKIEEKSIKMKDGRMTYVMDQDSFDKYKGLVGNPNKDGSLNGIWSLSSLGSGMGVVNEVLPLNVVDRLLGFCYTGDYDLHDLIKNGTRIVATTPDEHSLMDALNYKLIEGDPIRAEKIKKYPYEEECKTSPVRTTHSPYALVRHGAQTSFMDFMLSCQGKIDLEKHLRKPAEELLPAEDKIIKIDKKIVMFDSQGDAYILDSMAKVYAYYKTNQLLRQIPFYYFFNDLRQAGYDEEIKQYSKEINQILINAH